MDQRKNRIAVGGLRKAKPDTLIVLIQDVLRSPLLQLDPRTFADLMALSEVASQIPTQTAKELAAFRDQKLRELGDLPDGPALAEFLRDLITVPASAQPDCLREGVSGVCSDARHEDVVPAFEALEKHWATETPIEIELPKSAPKPKAKPAPKPRRARPAPESDDDSPSIQKVAPVSAPRRRRTNQVNIDARREDWMREDVLSRLVNYGNRGLKEQIIVAGTRHRAPWDDLTEKEVLAVLRKLKREGRVRFSAGRWMIQA